MNSDASPACVNRLLGYCALAHAASVFGLAFLIFSSIGAERNWQRPFWIVLVTLWFVWPLILALHCGRSWRRFLVFVLLVVVVLLSWLRFYNIIAPQVFG